MSMGSDPDASSNITNLPLSDPLCSSDSCLAFKTAHAASQAAVSYYHQYDYGHYTTWYYLAVVAVAMAIYAGRLYRNRRPPVLPTGPRKTSLTQKAVAVLRIVSYTHAKGRVAENFRLPSLGRALFLGFTWLFLLLLTFLIRPYYRERRGFGSPPLAVRTGLMSQALTPVIVALAGKVNVISFLTGIGHQKLNYLHRWASYMCLFLAIVHTVPFIYQPLHQPFGGPAALYKQYCKPGGYEVCSILPFHFTEPLTIKQVYWNSSTWHVGWACGSFRAMDPVTVLQPVLPHSHTHVCGLPGSPVLEFCRPAGLMGVSLGNACYMAHLSLRAVVIQVADIQHIPPLVLGVGRHSRRASGRIDPGDHSGPS